MTDRDEKSRARPLQRSRGRARARPPADEAPRPRETIPGEQPVLRIGSADDVCEAVPYLVGFEPTDCIVVVSMRGPRRRVGLVTRADLVPSRDARELAGMLRQHVVRDGGTAVLVVAYAAAADPDVDVVVHAVLNTMHRADVEVLQALRVTDNRWTSYTCTRDCCPPEGTPVRDRARRPGALAAALVAAGRGVLPSRAALEALLAPVTGLAAKAMGAALDAEFARSWRVIERDRDDPDRARETVRLATSWIDGTVAEATDRSTTEPRLPVDLAARLLLGLDSRRARDELLPWTVTPGEWPSTERVAAAEWLWRELTRRAVRPGMVAAPATLFGWSVYLARGEGALANIAVDRALDDRPEYVLAQYLGVALEQGLRPDALRELLASEPSGVPLG